MNAATSLAPSPALSAPSGTLRRDVGRTALLFTSVGSIIGSGWLLGALNATNIAGPAAILAWVGGAAAIMLLALVHAELGGMFPISGGLARFPGYVYGAIVGYGTGWLYWLGSVTLAPIEIEAALQYSDKWIDKALGFHVTHHQAGQVVLTGGGIAVAAAIMLAFCAINLYGVRRMSATNTGIVWWKIAIPVLAIVVIGLSAFHPSNFHAADGFAPSGASGVLSAVASGGVIFAYLGFEQAISFGGESRTPRRDIPFAVIGSWVLGTIVYILLEVVFVGSQNPAHIGATWSGLSFDNYGPYVGLANGLGIGWLAFILYVDAVVSPAGTGLIYTGSSSRLLYALGGDRYLPEGLHRLSPRGVPARAIGLSFVVGMVMFLPFPGWQKLVTFITSATVLVFGSQVLTMAVLRRAMPAHERPFRLPAAGVLVPMAFVVANLLALFSGWTTDWKLFAAVILGFLVLGVTQLARDRAQRVRLDLGASWWLPTWFAGLGLISYLGSFDGGRHTLAFGADIAVTVAWSLVVYAVALRQTLPASRIEQNIVRAMDAAAVPHAAPR